MAARVPEALSLTHHTLHTVLILKPAQCPSIFKTNFQTHNYNLKDKIHCLTLRHKNSLLLEVKSVEGGNTRVHSLL